MTTKMDKRCPKQLECMPDKWCELAVLRLKAIRNSGRELSEEEEDRLPGCKWAVDSQMAHYCFFKYLSEFTTDKNISDMELAALLNVSVETIKKIEKNALIKMREHNTFSDLKSNGEAVIDESDSADYKVFK